MKVYIVQHVHEFDDGSEDIKFIGVYSTYQKAEEAVKRLSTQIGFCETLEGFHIDEYIVDKDHWIEGYITVQ